MAFFRKKESPAWKTLLRADTAASGVNSEGFQTAKSCFIWWDSYSALLFYRLSSHYHQFGRFYWKQLFYRLNFLMNGCTISWEAQIGPGLRLPHPAGIVIGESVKIGDNANIHQNVCMGRRRPNEEPMLPIVIGNNVTIYAGAVFVSGIAIGDNAVIGANSVVLCDVPAGCTAAGNPARIIKSAEKNVNEMART